MMKTLLSAVLIAASLLSFGCKDDDDDPVNCNTWASGLLDEINAIQTTYAAYLDNQTPANCNAYKAAYQAYLDELRDAEECAIQIGQQAEWQADIDLAQSELDAIQC